MRVWGVGIPRRGVLVLLVGFLAGCGEFHFSPFPPCFPLCGGGGGGGDLPVLQTSLEADRLEVAPGAQGSLAVNVYAPPQGRSGRVTVNLWLEVAEEPPFPTFFSAGTATEVPVGQTARALVPVFVFPEAPPGEYLVRLRASAFGYQNAEPRYLRLVVR
uniref:Uncharacterized protein n=1 Tax=Thermus tengchongensis TaxID=1214928 RepID=A0A7V4A086_9DEIN